MSSNTSNNMKRITFLYSHPIQYFSPLLKKINEANICDLKVLYCQDTTKVYHDKEFGQKIKWDLPLLEGYKYNFLKEGRFNRKKGFFKYCNFSVSQFINKRETDILVVHGWGYATSIIAIILAYINGVEVWLRAESPYRQEILKNKKGLFIKKICLKYFLFKMVKIFLYIGEENRLFYKLYGINENKMVFTPYCVDNQRLQNAINKEQLNKQSARTKLDISEDSFVVLFSGKLIAKKNPLDLLKAFNIASIERGILIFLGDGVLMDELRKYVEEHKLEHKVLFAGFKNQTELPDYFLAADLFVLPSGMNETWGLVVNEAMNYGLPVIVSDLVGCVSDLVDNKKNGYTYPVGNVVALSEILASIHSDKQWLKSAGELSSKMIDRYSYETIVTSIKQCVK